jgi:hypothetical protein
MTPSTEELTRLLTGAADDLVERRSVPGPDTPRLWRRGRSTTWLARGAAAGLVALLVLVGGALVAVVRSAPPPVPAQGSSLTYPELVSNLFTGSDRAGSGPVFGLVALPGQYPQATEIGVVERSGALVGLPSWSASATGLDLSSLGEHRAALAPDGRHALVQGGILDLSDGSVARLLMAEGVAQTVIQGRTAWSPDSQHVAVTTPDGVAVLNGFADVELEAAAGDGAVLLAGWRDDATVLGVRSPSTTEGAALDIVTRGLTDPQWTTVGTVSADAVTASGAVGGRLTPSAAFASPDGSRLLLLGAGGRGVLVDSTTGQRVAFAGAASASADVAWDLCAPVWQRNQPLRAAGGLHRPADGATVLAFSDRVEAGCLALAGNELTGTPTPGRAWREQVWAAALPVGWALGLVGAVWLTIWMVVALRRSRKHGEDFLPMVLRLPF